MVCNGILNCTTSHKYVLVNKSFETLHWKSKDQLIGKTVFDIEATEFSEIAHAEDEKLIKNPGVSAYYTKVLDGLGVLHEVIVQKASLVDQQGNVTGLIGAILNITDHMRAE